MPLPSIYEFSYTPNGGEETNFLLGTSVGGSLNFYLYNNFNDDATDLSFRGNKVTIDSKVFLDLKSDSEVDVTAPQLNLYLSNNLIVSPNSITIDNTGDFTLIPSADLHLTPEKDLVMSSNSMSVASTGNMSITSAGTMSVTSTGDMSITSTGTMFLGEVKSGSLLKLDASARKLYINASPAEATTPTWVAMADKNDLAPIEALQAQLTPEEKTYKDGGYSISSTGLYACFIKNGAGEYLCQMIYIYDLQKYINAVVWVYYAGDRYACTFRYTPTDKKIEWDPHSEIEDNDFSFTACYQIL